MGDHEHDYLQGPAPTIPLYNSNLPLNQQLSPYLHIDPNIFRESQPQYILPEGAGPHRGAMELWFSTVGLGVLSGYGYGVIRGVIGARNDLKFKHLKGSNWMSQLTTVAGSQGQKSAAAFGGFVMTYVIFKVISGKLRKVDDELNSLIAGPLAGMAAVAFANPPRMKQAALQQAWSKWPLFRYGTGFIGGFVVAGLFTMMNPTSRRNLAEMAKSVMP